MRLEIPQTTEYILQLAQVIRKAYQAKEVGTEHILGALIYAKPFPQLDAMWDRRNLTWEAYNRVLAQLSQMPVQDVDFASLEPLEGLSQDFSERMQRIMERAAMRASSMGMQKLYLEVLVSALFNAVDCIAMQVLARLGFSSTALRQVAATLVRSCAGEGEEGAQMELPEGMQAAGGETKGGKTPTLDKYGSDLTEQCRNQKVDPVIGRNEEIERVMQILCRRTKNNPVLVGEPGVGKTAVAEGLAQRIASDSVPEILSSKRVISLDMAGMLAGAKYRGEFEERMKKVLKEATQAGNVILFIDELHTLIGAGGSEGAVDAANMLKPMLARGALQVIGATTLNEYRKYIEKDAALERRFQPVVVEEPSEEDTLEILRGVREKYEEHHRVQITDDALEAAVKLSVRYVSDRFLPDKAIDLMDEAAAKLRLHASAEPGAVADLQAKRAEILEAKEVAVREERFEEAAKLLEKQNQLEAELESRKRDWRAQAESGENVLTAAQIAEVVSSWTGIPASRLTEEDTERLKNLEERLREQVIGQDEAVASIAQAIRRGRLGLKDPKRPVGSFLFLGTTGVGKTELARALARVLFGDESAMIRMDMSEYMEKFDVSKLIGSPPGYVGYDDGGQLTEKVRRHPYSVILFDEIEKAHPDVFNMLLQILDDGRLTDSQGRTVNFSHSVIILTSNIGARLLVNGPKKIGFGMTGDAASTASDLYGGRSYKEARELVLAEMKQTFSPEFINRIDEILFFHMLDRQAMRQIVDLLLGQLKQRVSELGYSLECTEAALEALAEEGYDPLYGARPLRRVIQNRIEDTFSQAMLNGEVEEGRPVIIDVTGSGEERKFSVVPPKKTTRKKHAANELS